jgi:hypothetical protein
MTGHAVGTTTDVNTYTYLAVADSVQGKTSGASNIDVITDFVHNVDKIDLSAATFGTLTFQSGVSTPTSIGAHTVFAVIAGGSTEVYVNNTTAAINTAATGQSTALMEIHLTGVNTFDNSDLIHT